MLRTNLSTRPFYNERVVRLAIGVAGLLVAALTTYNVLQVLSLNAQNAEMSERAQHAERQTVEYRQKAQAIRQSLNTAEMTAVQQAAQEANLLIGRRVFSWTDLFNQFERTLPPEVRIAAVEPQVDNAGRLLVAITVLSRSAEDLNDFMDQLETSGRFHDVLNRQDTPMDDGLMRSVVQGYYDPAGTVPATPAAPTSDSPGQATNQSPDGAPNASAPAPRGER
jgi:Tfp pilus assembly protein PilN